MSSVKLEYRELTPKHKGNEFRTRKKMFYVPEPQDRRGPRGYTNSLTFGDNLLKQQILP